ncbi:MAG: UDP-N-acetylmuramate--L-alanine ligase [Wolbachia endosymbiont of Menacanthus eurysternus]|nr:MAG: UDP-N-acetylmuramate--L-alanine ligase [Wolbachia endosymbiont of Menacanthus eurysternus]
MNDIKKKIIHIIGIGGIGMSAIAEILHNLNYKVQGSDIQSNDNIDRLKKLGIEIYIGHSADNVKQAKVVVYSSAIKSDNVELIAARDNRKIILHRSGILSEIMRDKYVIAVSGSSGKTTTTAIISSIFDYSGINATVIVGGVLNSYRNNSKFGKSDIFLVEADESDGTMLKIPTNIAVITSINNDHIDYYGTFDNIKDAFFQFVNKADFAITPHSTSINYNGLTFGFKNGDIRASNIEQYSDSIRFDVSINFDENSWITLSNLKITKREKYSNYLLRRNVSLLSHRLILRTRIMKNVILSNAVGIHKISNALAAISVAIKLGISDSDIRRGLLGFKGVARRFSLIAFIKGGIRLIEDYAHHPNEIYATLKAARSISKKKVIGIIEPLRFIRIRSFFYEFIRVFMMFDYIILTSVHPPDDRPIPGCGVYDMKKALVNNGFNKVEIMNSALLISHFIDDFTSPDDIVLFIGAGSNIVKLAKETAAFYIK